MVLVPIWNRAYWSTALLREWTDAFVARRWERCACCGRIGLMLLRPRSIPPKLVSMWGLSKREAAALVRKETLVCSRCGAKLRSRRLACVLISTFLIEGKPSRSLREWCLRSEPRSLTIAEINHIEGLHESICDLPGLHYSDFQDAETAQSSGVPSEDLTRLSYSDETFDLVLTSETLEHVPDLSKALQEIHRILKPNGLHIFTIPVRPTLASTFSRREIRADGSVIDHVPKISHPGGDWGYPVFTEFGRDVLEVIGRAGFSTTEWFGPLSEDDLAQVYVSRKC